MRFDPNKLRLWLPVLTGTFAAVFLVCCDQLSGKIHPAATANTVVQAPAPAPAAPAKTPAAAPKAVSESPSAPVAELRTAEAPAPVRHANIRKTHRARLVPAVTEPASSETPKDSALPMVAAATPLPTSTPVPLAASDSLAPTSAAVANAKADVDSAAIPTAATEAKDSTFAVPAQAPASEKPASPTAQETPSQPTDPGRTSMLLPEEIRPQ